jgi:hypothetical protein
MEWLRMVKEYCKNIGISHCGPYFCFLGGAHKWWISLDKDIRLHSTWKEFENIFSDKWISDTKMEE